MKLHLHIGLLMAKPPTEADRTISEYKVTLEHASLFIRKVKVSPGVLLGHAKALEKKNQ